MHLFHYKVVSMNYVGRYCILKHLFNTMNDRAGKEIGYGML